jgi:hypothetical protein
MPAHTPELAPLFLYSVIAGDTARTVLPAFWRRSSGGLAWRRIEDESSSAPA